MRFDPTFGNGSAIVQSAPLARKQQIAIGVTIALVLSAAFIVTESLLPLALILGLIAAFLIVTNPVGAIFAFIISNLSLQFRPIDMVHQGAPGIFELLIGVLMTGISFYWLIRLRIFEGHPLSESVGQLYIALFAVWSVLVTALMLRGDHASFPNSLREMIDFVPLLILPILYSQFVKHDSRSERQILTTIFLSALIMIGWNILQVRNHIVTAVYLYQVGRGNTDNTLAVFIVLLSVSFLMSRLNILGKIAWSFVLMLALIGVVISLKRNLYVATIACTLVVTFLGSKQEWVRVNRRLLLIGIVCAICLTLLYFSSSVFHLLLVNYGLRFLTTQHIGTDLSLVDRYVEWKSEWHAILQSPIFGHGFGKAFRTYDVIYQYDVWRNYSHSSYLYMIFKVGFVGAFLFFAAYFSFLTKGFRLVKFARLSSRSRIITRAICGYLVVILINALTEPELDSKTDLIWIGLIWGFFFALEKSLKSNTN